MMDSSKVKMIGIILAVILVLSAVVVVAVQGVQNQAFALEEQVNAAQSDIYVQEKRRVDLIYNLADCVKEYDKHEAETLAAIVEGRGGASNIENAATAIAAVSEAYPELKADANYRDLMKELAVTENLIAQYRASYNKQVKAYNRHVRSFPARMFLDMLGYETIEFAYLDYGAPVDAPQDIFG